MQKDCNKNTFTCLRYQESIATDTKSCCKAICEKCSYIEYFLILFSNIWTDRGGLRTKSKNSVRIRKNTEQK